MSTLQYVVSLPCNMSLDNLVTCLSQTFSMSFMRGYSLKHVFSISKVAIYMIYFGAFYSLLYGMGFAHHWRPCGEVLIVRCLAFGVWMSHWQSYHISIFICFVFYFCNTWLVSTLYYVVSLSCNMSLVDLAISR